MAIGWLGAKVISYRAHVSRRPGLVNRRCPEHAAEDVREGSEERCDRRDYWSWSVATVGAFLASMLLGFRHRGVTVNESVSRNDKAPPARQDDHAVEGRARRWLKAARVRYEGSWIAAIVARLSALHFFDGTTIFGAELLWSALPFIRVRWPMNGSTTI